MAEAPIPAKPAGVASSGERGGEPIPSKTQFRIGEVCRLTGTKAFVLRYWETEFPMLAPIKSPKGHRLYRGEDVDLVFEIKRLLYEQGFTIAGARRWLESRNSPGAEPEASPPPTLPAGSSAARKLLADLEGELRTILTLLESE
ncbi:MAG TPA: MerR family transcriptional regulator [Candidatus Acidoferrales bacterium]|nr:MerR family transcriptional regulator [Candidatus Acidoferrales bacterium]